MLASEDIIGDPWDHPADFIIPEWAADQVGNGILDLDEIRGVWIKSLTTEISPDFVVWIDDLRLSTETMRSFSLSSPPELGGIEY